MSQAELLERVGVFDVGTEKVTDDGPAVSLPENFFEHLGTPRLCDDKEADKRGTEGPYSVFVAVILPAGFIDIQNRFGGDMFLKFFVWTRKSTAGAGDGVAQMASGDVDIQNIATERLQSTVGGMQRAFHVTYQRFQTRPKCPSITPSGKPPQITLLQIGQRCPHTRCSVMMMGLSRNSAVC